MGIKAPMIVAVDFDGTIVDHAYPKIGGPVPGAVMWLLDWQAAGAQIILWTMRSGEFLDEAVEYLKSNGVLLHGINSNPDQDWSDSPKAYAHLYVDDAAFGCPLIPIVGYIRHVVDWAVVGPAVLEMIRVDAEAQASLAP